MIKKILSKRIKDFTYQIAGKKEPCPFFHLTKANISIAIFAKEKYTILCT